MKKTLVSALTAALVVGAASTTFAAANPFSDVPADHWAYDAVSTLAADGVIEGYGDANFKGDKNITRYEMAQMVAKAMAKTNVGGNDKALLDNMRGEAEGRQVVGAKTGLAVNFGGFGNNVVSTIVTTK